MPRSGRRATVCFLGSARYGKPLNATEAGKWDLMAGSLAYDLRVIGFSNSLRPRAFQQGARFYLLPLTPFAPLRYLTFFALAPLLLLCVALRPGATIIVAQSPFEGSVAAFIKRVCRPFCRDLRLITENHNNFEEDLFLQRSIPLPGLYRKLMLAAARHAFRNSDALRVISRSTSERAREYAPDLPQVRFMTYSDSAVFADAKRAIPVTEAQDLVYAGVLIPRKGVHHLLEAFAKINCPGARLYLVGGEENADYARRLRNMSRELKIAERVEFVGAVSQRELAAYFGRARALVLPSLSEGLGRVVVEAMLLGMPVIGSRVGGIPDLIRDGENGWLFEAGDVSALQEALERIYDADVAAMGQRARAFALDFFSAETYADGYRQLFELVSDERV